LTLTTSKEAAPRKMLAKPQTQDDHALATGRRFKFRLPPPFSSRLSRYRRIGYRLSPIAPEAIEKQYARLVD
jgi:hypothetical protein